MTKYDIQWFFRVLFSAGAVGGGASRAGVLEVAGRRLLCGLEAVKCLHVGADAARIMQVLTANGGRK